MFRRQSILVALVVAAACDAPSSTAPRGPDAAGGVAADKQGITSSQILFSMSVDDGNEGAQPEIFRMDDDGTNIVRLTYELGTGEYNASWAPDGKRVLFVRDYYDHSVICVMNADGTGVTQLTSVPGTELDQFPIAFGKQIAFTRYEAGSTWTYIMNADGTGLTRLPQTAGGVYPGPSPKGGRIAFSRGGDIYLVDVTTGGLTNLTNSAESEQDPAYSPSGKQIAFARSGSDGGIFVMNDDGTAVTRVTTSTPNADTGPRWSPDGKRIAFTSTRDGSKGIYTINADGTGLTDLTRAPLTQEYLSAWARQ
jgi:Tol biopolymer transport system component